MRLYVRCRQYLHSEELFGTLGILLVVGSLAMHLDRTPNKTYLQQESGVKAFPHPYRYLAPEHSLPLWDGRMPAGENAEDRVFIEPPVPKREHRGLVDIL